MIAQGGDSRSAVAMLASRSTVVVGKAIAHIEAHMSISQTGVRGGKQLTAMQSVQVTSPAALCFPLGHTRQVPS